jgi:hypothetical protein
MAVINIIMKKNDYFKDVSLSEEAAGAGELLDITLASGERISIQFDDLDQNEELINKLIDAQIARKRQLGQFILKDL